MPKNKFDNYHSSEEKPEKKHPGDANTIVDLNSYRDLRYKNKPDVKFDYCLHDCCPRCHGSGLREDNQKMCIHHLDCACQKCIGFK